MFKRESSAPQERHSGHEHEADLFGDVPNYGNPQFARELAKISRPDGYAPRDQMIRLFRKHPEIQPGAAEINTQGQPEHNPENPKAEFLNDLRLGLLEEFDIDDNDPAAPSVEMFNSLKSPLDIFHGIDGFMVVNDKGEDIVITMDASLNKGKLEEGYKADIVIGKIPSAELEEEQYLSKIDELSEKLKKLVEKERNSDEGRYYRAA